MGIDTLSISAKSTPVDAIFAQDTKISATMGSTGPIPTPTYDKKEYF